MPPRTIQRAFILSLALFTCSAKMETDSKEGKWQDLKTAKHHPTHNAKVKRHWPPNKLSHEELVHSHERFARQTPAPATPPPTTPPNGVLDVGKVKAVSISESCNGVLLEPSLVLTSASCLHANHKALEYENVSFVLNGVSKKVAKIFGNGEWHRTGERKSNFALLRLAHPMTDTRASHLVQLTWSPYALEDIGESYLASPAPTSCQTASRKAKQTDTIRHVDDNIITVACTDRGMALPGSPFYRLVDGHPVIYGVYFGHCTSGSLDRKITGSCGSRLSKQVFQEFCDIAKGENIELPECKSNMLKYLNDRFSTTVYSIDTYNAISSTADNPKGAVFVYHSSLSTKHQELIDDIETIQRLKTVYDKFQMAIVDINVLPFDVKFVPFIEYRAVGGKTYLHYKDAYDFKQFKNFMDVFSRVGAPPSGSTSFIQHLNLEERSSTPANPVPGSGKKIFHAHLQNTDASVAAQCDQKAYKINDDPKKCECLPGYIGSGTPGNCQDLKSAVNANCRYNVQSGHTGSTGPTGQTYDQLKQLTKVDSWCKVTGSVIAYLNGNVNSVSVAGKELTVDDCISEIEEMIECPGDLPSTLLSDDLTDNHHNISMTPERFRRMVISTINTPSTTSERSRRSVTSTGSTPPTKYLKSFLGSKPPGPMTYPLNSYFVYQDWKRAANPFSSLFYADRGIPEYSAYKLTHANLRRITKGPLVPRRVVRKTWYFDKNLLPYPSKRQGHDKIYEHRGNKKYPNGVDRGHLNPSLMNSFDVSSMDLTHTHTNGYPQFYAFNNGVWKRFERKIFNYARKNCFLKSTKSEFYVITGLSDYKITGTKTSTLKSPLFWPVKYKGAVPQPPGSPPLPKKFKPIIQARSMWTVGCCSWESKKVLKGEAVSIWANNEPKGVTNMEMQPDLTTLAKHIYPGKRCFKFFPGNAECNKVKNHVSL